MGGGGGGARGGGAAGVRRRAGGEWIKRGGSHICDEEVVRVREEAGACARNVVDKVLSGAATRKKSLGPYFSTKKGATAASLLTRHKRAKPCARKEYTWIARVYCGREAPSPTPARTPIRHATGSPARTASYHTLKTIHYTHMGSPACTWRTRRPPWRRGGLRSCEGTGGRGCEVRSKKTDHPLPSLPSHGNKHNHKHGNRKRACTRCSLGEDGTGPTGCAPQWHCHCRLNFVALSLTATGSG